eukprot:1142362-Pelagomonas_calceolata.AAC.10
MHILRKRRRIKGTLHTYQIEASQPGRPLVPCLVSSGRASSHKAIAFGIIHILKKRRRIKGTPHTYQTEASQPSRLLVPRLSLTILYMPMK